MSLLSILHIEDEEADQVLLKKAMGDSPLIELVQVSSLAKAVEATSERSMPWNVVIADLNLPDSIGDETIQKVKSSFPCSSYVFATAAPEFVKERPEGALVVDKRKVIKPLTLGEIARQLREING